MSQQAFNSQLSELITEIETIEGVCFDPSTVSLHGLYCDELSAHRARRGWIEILESSFFLEREEDFTVKVQGDTERGRFVLTCDFLSASARYAFWRLTHQQAPEAQYLIETAHIPSNDRFDSLNNATDLTPLVDDPIQLGEDTYRTSVERRSLVDRIVRAVHRLIASQSR